MGDTKNASDGLAIRSEMNFYRNLSASSMTELRRTGKQKEVNLVYNRRVVTEIVDKIFEDQIGTIELSSSRCSSVQFKPSQHSFDQRLKYWKDVLADRKRMGAYIKEKTGKPSGDILFNRATTFDERDKQTVKRLLDYAERMRPINVMTKKPTKMKERLDMETCRLVPEVEDTLPKAEQVGEKVVEISGMPAATKEEQLGPCREQGVEKPTHWLRSKWLEKHIVDNREDLERVVEFYPDIEHLQIVGQSVLQQGVPQRSTDIKLLYEETIRNISGSSSCDNICDKADIQEKLEEEIPEYGIKINDHIFLSTGKRGAKVVESEVTFECQPFQKLTKCVLRLENVGRKVINCEWAHRAYFNKISTLLKAVDDEFLFNRRPFRLLAGELREIIVQFQPRTVNIIKEKWVLKIDPQFFCRKSDMLIVKLNGKCKPSPMYVDKLEVTTRTVLEKSNIKMMHKLANHLASLTPIIKPSEVMCPYRRTLDEREIFEFHNSGYKCERFHDLELLKEIYNRIKKPREHSWDLKLESLRTMILRLEGADQRALVFSEMVGVLEEMKGVPYNLEEKIEKCPERDRTRLLYVRGIICTCIDEWEELTINVEDAFFKPALKEYQEYIEEEEAQEIKGSEAQTMAALQGEDISEIVLKKVRHRKAFRDSLYMQTYTHLCDYIENIVSIIESTEII